MTRLRLWLDAVVAIVSRDTRIFFSYRMRFVSTIGSLFFSLALFYYVSRLVHVDSFETPDQYYAFVVVGLLVMRNLTATLLFVPPALRQELVAGTFERHMLSPFGPVSAVTSMAIFPFISALVTGVIMIVFAVTVFGMPPPLRDCPALALHRGPRGTCDVPVCACRCGERGRVQTRSSRYRLHRGGDLACRRVPLSGGAAPVVARMDFEGSAVHADRRASRRVLLVGRRWPTPPGWRSGRSWLVPSCCCLPATLAIS